MSIHSTVVLTKAAMIRTSEAAGIPILYIDPDGAFGASLSIALGGLDPRDDRAAALDQLRQLQAAVSAAFLLLGEREAPVPGPDDPTDEPTDDPATESWGDGAWDADHYPELVRQQAELDTQGEPMGGWEPRS